MFAGIIIRPTAISSRIKLRRQLLRLRHVRHLFGDQPFARKVHLAHVPVAGARGLFLPLHDPVRPRRRHLVSIAVRARAVRVLVICVASLALILFPATDLRCYRSYAASAHSSLWPTRSALLFYLMRNQHTQTPITASQPIR